MDYIITQAWEIAIPQAVYPIFFLLKHATDNIKNATPDAKATAIAFQKSSGDMLPASRLPAESSRIGRYSPIFPNIPAT